MYNINDLMNAIENNDKKKVEEILKKNSGLATTCKEGIAPLVRALEKNSETNNTYDICELLVKALRWSDLQKNNYLYYAVKYNIAIANLMLAKEPSCVNAKDKYGNPNNTMNEQQKCQNIINLIEAKQLELINKSFSNQQQNQQGL